MFSHTASDKTPVNCKIRRKLLVLLACFWTIVCYLAWSLNLIFWALFSSFSAFASDDSSWEIKASGSPSMFVVELEDEAYCGTISWCGALSTSIGKFLAFKFLSSGGTDRKASFPLVIQDKVICIQCMLLLLQDAKFGIFLIDMIQWNTLESLRH